MRSSALVATALSLPLFTLAQSQSQSQPQPQPQSQNNSQPQPFTNFITSTVFTTFVTLGPSRQVSTVTSSFVFTTAQVITPAPAPTSNGTVSGNSTLSANSTTTPRNLPTAPTNVDGGAANGAPSPGQTGVGGIYGPDDSYTAAAIALKRNAFTVAFVGLGLGAAMLFF